jgi:predicted Na+-dependent transporter
VLLILAIAWSVREDIVELTVAIELGVKNTTIGILIAVSVIGIEEVAVPSAVYGLLMYGTAFAMVGWARRWTEQRVR